MALGLLMETFAIWPLSILYTLKAEYDIIYFE